MTADKGERKYSIFLNEEDEILISIKTKEGKPEKPFVAYDGGDHAILYRSKGKNFVLDFIHIGVQEILSKAQFVNIVEKENDVVSFLYVAKVKHLPVLPLSADEFPSLANLNLQNA